MNVHLVCFLHVHTVVCFFFPFWTWLNDTCSSILPLPLLLFPIFFSFPFPSSSFSLSPLCVHLFSRVFLSDSSQNAANLKITLFSSGLFFGVEAHTLIYSFLKQAVLLAQHLLTVPCYEGPVGCYFVFCFISEFDLQKHRRVKLIRNRKTNVVYYYICVKLEK